MGHIERFSHAGLTVIDLDVATEFFVALGLEVVGTGEVSGEFVETVCGIDAAHCRLVMLQVPGTELRVELSTFVHPEQTTGTAHPLATEVGLRNISFEVADLRACLADLAAIGYGLVGGVGTYQNSVRMAYVRGPDGIVVSLFETIDP